MRKTILYCHEDKRTNGQKFYSHFYMDTGAVGMCGDKTILKVEVAECDSLQGCYWGWWNNKSSSFKHVYQSKIQVEMCFPNSINFYEDRGEGFLLPVSITVLEKCE